MSHRFVFVLLVLVRNGLGETESITYERFHVDSVIVSRYARTVITSVLRNSADVSKEVSFRVKLPDTAFISNFTMEVNGTIYLGLADEKKKASAEYESRKGQGQNVGLVESKGSNVFGININTAAGTRSTFVITYEELITRSLSKYQQIITLNPGSVVADLHVSIRVVDSQGILRFNGSSFVNSRRLSDKEVLFTYAPSLVEQNDSNSGLLRDVSIEYDVNHPTDNSAGLIIINDCYFAQFFSPGNVPIIPVDIVFVIDVSGSMAGRKIQQAKASLAEVISQLNDNDHFTIVTFSSNVNMWRETLVPVVESREDGKAFASDLNAKGGTNFNEAMITSINILKKSANSNHVQLLVMLSDGEPTAGVTNPNMIVNTATKKVANTRISLNMIGFGTNLNLLLLQRLAIGNRGIVKQIFEGKDAAGQLEGFYMSISSPIFHSLNFSYPSKKIEAISDVKVPLLFKGSEVVVAGKFNDSACTSGASIPVTVNGMGAHSEQTFTSVIDPTIQTVIAGIKPSTERLVAYLRIQQLLRSLKVSNNLYQRNQALRLAMKYNFVTELTSLIVVEESVVRKIPQENFTIVCIPKDSILIKAEPHLEFDAQGGVHGPLQAMAFASPAGFASRVSRKRYLSSVNAVAAPPVMTHESAKMAHSYQPPHKIRPLPPPPPSPSPTWKHRFRPLPPPEPWKKPTHPKPRNEPISPMPPLLSPSPPIVKVPPLYDPHQPHIRRRPPLLFPTTTSNSTTTTTESRIDDIVFMDDDEVHSGTHYECKDKVAILIFHFFYILIIYPFQIHHH